jgi:transposase
MLPAGEVRIYLACDATDMRKGFHSLAAQVQTALNHDPYSGALYIFRGRRGDLIKISCIQTTTSGLAVQAVARQSIDSNSIDNCAIVSVTMPSSAWAK